MIIKEAKTKEELEAMAKIAQEIKKLEESYDQLPHCECDKPDIDLITLNLGICLKCDKYV